MAVDTLARTLAAGMGQNVTDVKNAMQEMEAEFETMKSMVGTPLQAATSSAMTDHNKIYVYTGSQAGYTYGHWYYWNGSAWADGGVYNSIALETDKTLSISDMAADAKVVGDDITDLKNAIPLALSHTGASVLPDNANLNDYIGTAQSQEKIGNFKVTTTGKAQTITNIPEQTAGRLIVMQISQMDRILQVYITANQHIYYRFYTKNGWQAWKQLHVDTTLSVENAPADASAVGTAIASLTSATSSLTSDVNNIKATYFAITAGESTALTENYDIDGFSAQFADFGNYKVTTTAIARTITKLPEKVPGKLTVMQLSQSQRTLMIYTTSTTKKIFCRFYNGTEWSKWVQIADSDAVESSYANQVTSLFRFNPFFSHAFLGDASQEESSNQIIPSESIHDIEISRRLGFDCIEANTHETSDGQFVVIHGEDNKWGYEVEGVGGTDISNIAIGANTMAWIKSNVRYKSKYAKYRTAPLEFKEWLKACRANNMIPLFRFHSAQNIADADEIMGKNNYIVYNATRADTNACISYYTNSFDNADDLIAYFDSWTPPLIISTGNWASWSDSDIEEVVEWAHNKGFLMGIPGNYMTQARVQKHLNMNFDVSGSTSNIKAIKDGNMLNAYTNTGFSDFVTTGTVTDGVLTLAPGQYVEITADRLNSEFLCGSTVFARGEGSVIVNMRSRYMPSFGVTLSENRELQVSTFYLEQAPSFRISVSSTEQNSAQIYSLEFHASKF